MTNKVWLRTFAILFSIGLLACVYFGLSYGHTILTWKQFDQSFHGHWHSTPLWYENQVDRASHWLIVAAIYTCVTGGMWIGILRTNRRTKSA